MVVLVGLPFAAVAGMMAARVGDTARFVTWPIVAFVVVAGAAAMVATWVGMARPALLLLGLIPAAVISYVMPALPLPVIAIALVVLGGISVVLGPPVSGVALGTSALMALFVFIQGPVVQCGESSVSTNSGPFWIPAPSTSSGSSSLSLDGDSRGTTQVGDDRYNFRCVRGELVEFERQVPG